MLTFVGLITAKLPEDRIRYWNAYLLFYERKANQRLSGNRRSSRLQMLRKSQSSPINRHDSLSELSELVHQGEQQVPLDLICMIITSLNYCSIIPPNNACLLLAVPLTMVS